MQTRLVAIFGALVFTVIMTQSVAGQPADRDTTAERLLSEALQLQARGDPRDTESILALMRQALERYELSANPAGTTLTLLQIAKVFNTNGPPDSALVYYQRALAIGRNARSENRRSADLLRNVGSVHQDLGRTDSALAYYRLARAAGRRTGDRLGLAATFSNFGTAYLAIDRPDSALIYFQRSLEIREEANDRSGAAATLSYIGAIHMNEREPASALPYFRRALETYAALTASDAVTLSYIGAAHLDTGEPDSALTYLQRALDIRQMIGDVAGEGSVLSYIGVAHQNLNRPDSALTYLRRALTLERQVNDSASIAATLAYIGTAHQSLSRPDSAIVNWRDAYHLYQQQGLAGAAATLESLLRGAGEAYAVFMLNRSPLLRPGTDRVVQDAYLAEVKEIVSGLPANTADSIRSIEEATSMLEQMIERHTVFARISSEPERIAVAYWRVIDSPGENPPEVMTNTRVPIRPALSHVSG